jgi:Coenzyme PQQ synthesis protein D (PqqD)
MRSADVTFHRRSDDGATLIERHGRYVRLSPAAAAIWHWCDGERDVDTIVECYREHYASDGAATIPALVDRWLADGFLTAENTASGVPAVALSDGIVRRGGSVLLAWRVERWAVALRTIACGALAWPMLLGYAAIALAGGALGLRMGTMPLPHTPAQSGALVVALLAAVFVHEGGHALTLARFGGTIRRMGIGWYWCAPIAFVDTSDAHALPRPQRIAVSLGGPIASFIFAALASIVASCPLPEDVRSVAWSLAIVNYGISLWNLNPLIELDGYYVLTDMLDRPNLRSDAFRALRGRRASPIEFAYALGALGYALIFATFTLPAVVHFIRATFVI